MNDEITLVIADDQPLMRKGLAALLHAEEGFRVLGTAADGQEAVELIGKLQPAAALLDIHMPTMDGLEAARRIKERSPDVLIFMLTTFKDDDYIWRAMQAGAVGYLLKDSDTEDMVRIIRDGMAGRMNFPAIVLERLQAWLTAGGESVSPADEASKADREWEELFSPREIDIIRLLMKGRRNSDIAGELFLSEGTVKNYVGGIYRKMKVARRGEAMAWLQERMGGLDRMLRP
ncbi:response regulator [Paenibacillus chungangensis]|uniref:Response regulator n=1 Tax=Paenibacillus chungangensis TaxID=696535 RepID=A0ABW3HVW3_9BACL